MTTKKMKKDGYILLFEDSKTMESFEPITLELIDAYEEFLGIDVSRIWIDVGFSGIYDLHIELTIKGDEDDFYDSLDVYLEFSGDDDLIGVAFSKGTSFKRFFGCELTNKIIAATKLVKEIK